MLILETVNDCEYIRVTTDPETYPATIADNPSDICCWTLTLGVNCCEPKIVLPIRGIYDFSYSISDCGFELLGDVNTPYIDITIAGINVECVSQVTMTNQSGNGVLTFTGDDLTDMTFRSYVTGPSQVRAYEVKITTTCNLVYTLSFIISFNGDICDYSQSGIFVVDPELPEGVEADASSIRLYPAAFGQTGDTLAAGIYFVSLDPDPGAVLSNSIFVDCEVICKIVDYVAKYPTSNIWMLFEALQAADDCTTITYAQKCSIWNYLGRRLGYFTNSTPCPQTSNCSTCKKK